MKSIKKFKISTKELSRKEKALFQKLVKTAELIAPLYLKQKNNKYLGANFYPHDAKVGEIKKAAKKDPAILSPYTFVERNKSGKLIAIPYHMKFRKELKPIAKLLIDAAGLSDDYNFSQYLISRAHSLLNGKYEESEIFWLKAEPFKLSFVIGPLERYLDKLFFTKCAYQAWVGILDEKRTKEAEKSKNIILTGRRKILAGSEKVDISKVGIRVDKTAIFSGLIADFLFIGTNLPNSVDLMEKYGSNLSIFDGSLDLKFKNRHFPIFKTVFGKNFQKSYSKDLLHKGSLRCILSHEICHSLIRYRDAEKRLGRFFPILDELYANILGIKSYGPLLLKGVITQKELEAILIMHICWNFTLWFNSLKNPETSHSAFGSAIAQNFYLKEGAIEIKKGISWPNFTKLFICIDELSHILEYHLAIGNYKEAKEFIDEYGSFDIFKLFLPGLKRVLKKN
ncbi:MAG TPA: hypothetical protein ENI19_02690 [Candidatus Nealsonbacteria bacterium]|uniref:Uncharacterized protein n=1 Tax=marine sediment metagenome TaxID=412755 RepID=A0A0F9UJU0_9ZZZZ|nr:hypothetical protein [Candidatus Nealsonbacteria bacterium]HEB46594.1 hypothetical protein [Candidatus Nealsonbacteria bacterium]